MGADNDALVAQMEEGTRERANYARTLQEEQAGPHMLTLAYGEIQQAEPLAREADAGAFVAGDALAEVSECIGCLENQPDQVRYIDPSGCLYDESDEELDWGELGAPPAPPQLIRQRAERISYDEVIVLNGEYIVCG